MSTLELRQSVARGLAWNLSGQVALQISRVAIAVVLARLLTPHAYGLVGMIVVFDGLVLLFTDAALGVGLIQRKTITEDDRSTVFWTTALFGLLLTGAGIAASSAVASFYGQPAVRSLFAVYSIGFVISSLGSTHGVLLQREMQFRTLQFRLVGATVLSGVVAILAAAAGWGAWALVTQALVSASVGTAFLWFASDWHPRLRYSRASLRNLGGFGAKLFGARFLFYVNGNADNVLVGRVLGSSALGVYAVAYNVMLIPFARLVYPIQQTLLPALSRIQEEPERIARLWLRANRAIAAVVVPAMVGLIVVAPDLVPVVFGERWHGLVRVVQILATSGLVLSLSSLCTSILVALGRTTSVLRFAVAASVLQLTGFGVGLHWGVKGVATGFVLANALLVPSLVTVVARALGTDPLEVARNLSGVLAAAAAMGGAALLVRFSLGGVDTSVRLVVVIVAGIGVYVALCFWRLRDLVDELRSLLPNG